MEFLSACSEPIDVVFGLPTSQDIPADQFQSIKKFVSETVDSFDVDPMKVHVGLLTYSDTASTALKIDQLDSKSILKQWINQLTQQGRGVSVVSALNEATHNTFTIFGGTRQSVPKAFVLLVSEGYVKNRQEVLAAANRLKSLGVKLLTVAVGSELIRIFFSFPQRSLPQSFSTASQITGLCSPRVGISRRWFVKVIFEPLSVDTFTCIYMLFFLSGTRCSLKCP